MVSNSKLFKWLFLFFSLAIIPIVIISIKSRQSKIIDSREQLSLDKRVELSLDVAEKRLLNTIFYLEKRAGQPGKIFPEMTVIPPSNNPIYKFFPYLNQQSQSLWNYSPNTSKWSNGAFPALLWKIYLQETNPTKKRLWQNKAKIWSESLRENNYTKPSKDMAINNIFVFKHWYENSNGSEKTEQLNTIFQGAKVLVTPLKNRLVAK